MPTYSFHRIQTGEVWSEFMGISEMERFLEENPGVELSISAPALVSGVSIGTSMKPDKGFREILSDIKRKNPTAKINDHGG